VCGWRLCARYEKPSARGKNKTQTVAAIRRELLGFVWAIAVKSEGQKGVRRKSLQPNPAR
jgi:hypothetical protein